MCLIKIYILVKLPSRGHIKITTTDLIYIEPGGVKLLIVIRSRESNMLGNDYNWKIFFALLCAMAVSHVIQLLGELKGSKCKWCGHSTVLCVCVSDLKVTILLLFSSIKTSKSVC